MWEKVAEGRMRGRKRRGSSFSPVGEGGRRPDEGTETARVFLLPLWEKVAEGRMRGAPLRYAVRARFGQKPIDFLAQLAAQDRPLPAYVREAFEAYLRCGVLEHDFLRVVCEQCHAERLVAFSCKKRGFCPSCGARRMAESARQLVDDVFGPRPVRQWVLSFPYPLRFLFASKPEAISPVLGIVQRVIGGWLADQAGVGRAAAHTCVHTPASSSPDRFRSLVWFGRARYGAVSRRLHPRARSGRVTDIRW